MGIARRSKAMETEVQVMRFWAGRKRESAVGLRMDSHLAGRRRKRTAKNPVPRKVARAMDSWWKRRAGWRLDALLGFGGELSGFEEEKGDGLDVGGDSAAGFLVDPGKARAGGAEDKGAAFGAAAGSVAAEVVFAGGTAARVGGVNRVIVHEPSVQTLRRLL